jgi:hypothetical protein
MAALFLQPSLNKREKVLVLFTRMFSDECLGSQPRGSGTSHSRTLLAASYHRRIRLLQTLRPLHS